MDLQFHGANCLTIASKRVRLSIDDNLAEMGAKSATKPNDVVMFTSYNHPVAVPDARLVIDCPGEYEVGDILIQGFAVRAHTDEEGKKSTTLYKVSVADMDVVITGHMYPDLSDKELEEIGLVDVLCIPVGGNGYTLDGIGALKIIKKIEPKIVVPTHYDDSKLKFPVPQRKLLDAIPPTIRAALGLPHRAAICP